LHYSWDGLVDRENDIVNNPSHYTQGKIEVIDFIIDQNMDYLTASALKYLCRYKHKHIGEGQIEDLRKARFYIDKLIDSLKIEDIK
jgi:hypothetical protein